MKGKWHYLYRAINKRGGTVDFFFSRKRNKEAAYQFLKRCLRRYKTGSVANLARGVTEPASSMITGIFDVSSTQATYILYLSLP